MSRLTASPFHKPSPFDFPHAPPSPPETYSDTITGPPHILPPTHSLAVQDFAMMDGGLAGASPDTPSRGKKSSSIPYHSTSFRETKERASQRTSKSLIIVIPPSTLIQEHGQHGHTLSNGPYHRLSQGVVMPLFPSMFGQLTAIAREFNFPSTSGLCLYFHYVEEGLTLTPRITDDSWQTLWGHLSEPLRPNERRPLIGGKVEFDIDLRLARWYAAWLSSIHREISEHPSHSYPATAPSLAHFRRESSQGDSRHFEDDTVENSGIHQHSAPIGRHVPRKLSLVERFDVASARPDTKVNPRSVGSPPEMVPSSSHVLSTIVQEEEPKSARRHLDRRVNSWMASAVISPTPLAATGQTSLDPSNLPNNMTIDTPVETPNSPAVEELNLEDFTWSVSSAGPPSPGDISLASWFYPPSVHLVNRMESSVCTSPSTCTSFGPLDDDVSLVSTVSRIPSPDIAQRFYEDSPPTPMTATSWGAPLSYPPTPYSSISGLPSPDLAQRFYEDSPPTPMTATSWGAPLSYPASPRCVSPTPSLDTGERSRFSNSSLSSLTAVRRGSPWTHVWPYNSEHYKASVIESIPTLSPGNPWSHVWPYTSDQYKASTGVKDSSCTLSPGKPWSHVWPYTNKQYRVSVEVKDTSHIVSRGNPWPHVWPYNSARSRNPSDSHVPRPSFGYPYINIYHPVYPHLEIYPSVPGTMKPNSSGQLQDRAVSIQIKLPAKYPTIDLYPAIYPYNLDNIYPVIIRSQKDSAEGQEGYPFFNIYPPTSPPYFGYRSLHICNPRSQYPDFEIYPKIITDSDHNSARKAASTNSEWPHLRKYPILHIYAAVYPYFELYPSVEQEMQKKSNHLGRALRTILTTTYPTFNLYPAVYPHFDIYPAQYASFDKKTRNFGEGARPSLSAALQPMYPSFNLYPGVYPHHDIYPAPYGSNKEKVEDNKHVLTPALVLTYPFFNLYPAVYPYLDIYPAPYFSGTSDPSISTRIGSQYPFFNLYPAVYPYFDLYLSRPKVALLPPQRKTKYSSRLTHAELHAMVMMERPGSFGGVDSIRGLRETGEAISSQMSMIDEDEEIGQYLEETSASNAARNIHLSSSAIPASDLRGSSMSYKSGSAAFFPKVPSKPDILRSSRFREQPIPKSSPANERDISRSSGLREQPRDISRSLSLRDQPRDLLRSSSLREQPNQSSVILPPKPLAPRRRDSLVLQRVKAFDQSAGAEKPTGISRETLAKFPMPPMPPNGFPLLPPLPINRTN